MVGYDSRKTRKELMMDANRVVDLHIRTGRYFRARSKCIDPELGMCLFCGSEVWTQMDLRSVCPNCGHNVYGRQSNHSLESEGQQ